MPEQYYHSDPLALHTSRRETLQRCPRRFYIEYVLGLERILETPEGLRMGDAHAHALEMADPDAVVEKYGPLIEACTDEFKADKLVKEAQVVKIYVKRYLEIYPKAFQREIIWDLPILGTEYRDCGTIDFVEKSAGGIFGGEDKLYSMWDDSREQAIDVDDQVTGEIHGLIGMGYTPVLGLKYRVTKKAQIRQRMKNKPETWDEYLERLEQKLIDDQSDHFLEFTTTRTVEELREFEEELLFAAEYIDWMREREADGRPTFPRSPKTCSWKGGCAHPEVCMRQPDWHVLYRQRGDRKFVRATAEQMNLLAHGS